MQKIFSVSIKTFILTALLGSSFFFPSLAEAESYALYVNENAKSGGDGSKDNPFREIDDAVKKAKDGDKISVSKGSYKGGFEIPSKVGLVGESRDGVVISGTVTASSGASLENLTVSGGATGVLLKKNANVTISKCTIKDAAKIGIDVPPGNGKLIVKDSKIHGNAKGFYVQAGNQFQLSDSSVYKNGEEGIDLRNNNDGFIKNNEIYGNGESGIEVILGKTDMVISGNSIKDNKASGIATQYYEAYGDDGKLVVKGNEIKGNDAYGVKCGTPQGGNGLTSAYWGKSIELGGNEFGGNGEGDIESRCKILTDEEKAELERIEKEKIAKAELLKAEKLEREKTEEQRRIEEEQRKQRELEEAIRVFQEQAAILENGWKDLEAGIDLRIAEIENRGRFSYWLLGPKKETLGVIESDMESGRQKISEMRSAIGQAPSDETRVEIEGKINSLEQSVSERERFLESKKNELSFWTRTRKLFSS